LSPEIGIVVDSRITSLYDVGRGKADAVQRAEGSSPGHAKGGVCGTPPGSESGACIHRVARELGRANCLLALQGIGKRVTSEAMRDGLLAVVAEHSTDGASATHSNREGGEPRPK
jgi:hypothetical protein